MKDLEFRWDSRGVKFVELLVDLAIVVFGLLVVLYFDDDLNRVSIYETFDIIRDLVVTHSVLLLLALIFFRVYDTTITKNGFTVVMPKIVLALIMANVLTAFVSLILPTIDFSVTLFVYSLLIQSLILGVFKFAAYRFLLRVNIKTAIIIGPKEQVDDLAAKLLQEKEKYVQLKYLFYEDKENKDQVLKMYEYIDNVDYVYLTPNLYEKKKNAIISYCVDKSKNIFLIPKIYELAVINAQTDQIGDVLAFSISGMHLTMEQRFIKRTFDLFVSIIGLILVSPLLLITAIIVKVSDGGPVFFVQERLTKNNKPFNLIKFRTMVPNAEKLTGPVLATEKDPRITKFGAFMRRTRIDELPQFINIIKGDMSIVGPRPERQFFVDQFVEENPTYRFRLNVKAGVTGLAQALGKYNTNFHDKLRFDLYYIRNYSFFFDMSVLLHTVRAVFDTSSTEGVDVEGDVDVALAHAGYMMLRDKDVKCLRVLVRK